MLDRRQLMMTGVSAVALGVGAQALAQEAKSAAPEKTTKTSIIPEKNLPLVDAASECIKVGETCLEHCLDLMSQGDKGMGKCAATVRAMLPMVEALQALATQDSPHLKELATLCAKVCRDCEKACKVHQNHHEICKQCMESCGKCAKECEKYTSAA